MADRQTIITLKTHLDALRLPSQFAPEDAPLLAKLVARLQQAEGDPFSPRKDWKTDQTQEHSRQFSQAEQTLNMQMARLFQENNQLRRETWTARQASEELRMAIMNKWASKIEQSGGQLQQQFRAFIERGRREQQLASELQQVRYKYNELMDLIHQDPPLQRQYLRRLLKHQKLPNRTKSTSNLHPDSRIVEGHSKEIVEGSSEASILKGRLMIREEEILRLQAIIEQNNSYVHYRYQEQKHLRAQFLLNEEIQQLQTELNKLKANLPKSTHTAKPTNKPKSQQKQDFAMKKYVQQFETEKHEGSYILEQRYVHASSTHKQTHKEKEKPKDKQQPAEKGSLNAQSEYFHNSRIGQTAKPDNDKKQFLSPQVPKKNQAKSPTTSKQPNVPKQSIQGGPTTSDAHHKSPSNVHKTPKEHPTKDIQQQNSKKTQNKPKESMNSPKHAQSPQPHQLKLKGQDSKQASLSAHESRPQKKSPQSKQQKLISTYQKLLEQKDARIAFLQQSLKASPSRSTKVISAQNINSNNSPSKNVVIKNNRNEYISINNIQNTRQNENKANQQQAKVETQLANAAKQRQELAHRVQTLQNEKSKEKIQEHSKSKLVEKDHQREKLRENEQSLKKKLVAVQQSLLLTNDMNIALQKQVNELLAAQKPPQKPARQANPFLSVYDGNQGEQGQRIALTSFPSQIQRLKEELSSLTSQKQGLLARLDEYAQEGKRSSQKQSIRVDSNREEQLMSSQQSRHSQKESRDLKISKDNKSSVVRINASKQDRRTQAQREMIEQVISTEKQVPFRNQANNRNSVVNIDKSSQNVRKPSQNGRNSREQLYQLQVMEPSHIQQDILQMKQRQIRQLTKQVARLQQQNHNLTSVPNETQLRKPSSTESQQPKQQSSITISQQASKIAEIHRQTEVYAQKMQEMKAAYESLKRELSGADQLAIAAQTKTGLEKERAILPIQKDKPSNRANQSNNIIQNSPQLASRHDERNDDEGRLSQGRQQLQFQVSSLRMQVSALEKQLQQLTHQKEVLIEKLEQAAMVASSDSNGEGGLRDQLRRIEEQARQERNNSDALRSQLKQAHNSLLALSKQNATLQNELTLLSQKPLSPTLKISVNEKQPATNNDKPLGISNNQEIILVNDNQGQSLHNCHRSQQLTITITYLQSQLHLLQLQIISLKDERIILLARLKELEAALHKQATEMRTFEHKICFNDPQSSLSGISELAELHQDSEIR